MSMSDRGDPPAGEGPAVERPVVLLVEDDDALRSMLARILRSAGYEVVEADNGDDAVEAFERRCPDLLLSDLVLPGLNGKELADRCRDRCPRAVLVFMSGYSEDELHRLQIRQVVFLPKPIRPRDMLVTLERLLER